MMEDGRIDMALARKWNDRTGRKEFCLALFVCGYPGQVIRFFGEDRPTEQEIEAVSSLWRVHEMTRDNDIAISMYDWEGGIG